MTDDKKYNLDGLIASLLNFHYVIDKFWGGKCARSLSL